jgi:hemerythrin-like domain-containing protein
MNAIALMIEEHKNIKRMLVVVRKACFKIFNGDKINYDDLQDIISVIRNYADSHHHKKEEVILFNKMIDEIGGTAEKIVKYGMLVEHDLGRLYIKDLEEALKNLQNGNEEAILDVISNAISYTHLLERHITKEDNVVYKFAERELKEEIIADINNKCIEFEKKNNYVKDENIVLLERLEEKYK